MNIFTILIILYVLGTGVFFWSRRPKKEVTEDDILQYAQYRDLKTLSKDEKFVHVWGGIAVADGKPWVDEQDLPGREIIKANGNSEEQCKRNLRTVVAFHLKQKKLRK